MSKTQYPDLFGALAEPFDPSDVKSRNQGGRQLNYITARTVMNRLDDALGPENWWDSYPVMTEHSVLCRLTIRLPDGTTLTKEDAGARATMQDEGDNEKSAYSDALKRTAAKFGVGRYLYRDGVPSYGTDGASLQPAASQPAQRPQQPRQEERPPQRDGGDKPSYGAPRTGRALFAWCKEQEGKHGKGLVDAVNTWAQEQGWPGRMVDWSEGQVNAAHAEACWMIEAKNQGVPAGAPARQQLAPAAKPTPAPKPAAAAPALTGADLPDDDIPF